VKTAISIICVSAAISTLLGAKAVATLANTPPAFGNVTANQQMDGSTTVEMRRDLSGADNDACTVTVQVSDNGGVTRQNLCVDRDGRDSQNQPPQTSEPRDKGNMAPAAGQLYLAP
jgi:hypothetical protein